VGRLRRHWWYHTLPRRQPPLGTTPAPELSEDEQRRVRELLTELDTPDAAARDEAWSRLPPGGRALPLMLEAFPTTTRMEARITMVYEATFFARVSEDAFQLGVLGCRDRSKFVRDRACGVLAYSLRPDALPFLRPLLRAEDDFTRESAEAAVAAIKERSHHRFWDREAPRGQTFWTVNRGDNPWFPDAGRDIDAELRETQAETFSKSR
jgi:hypothetical protein